MRDVVADVGGHVEREGGALESGFEEDGRDGAVDVVVPVDEDGFACEKGLGETVHGGLEAAHEEGIVEAFGRWMEKRPGVLRAPNVASPEDLGQGDGEVGGGGEGVQARGSTEDVGCGRRRRGHGRLLVVVIVDDDAAHVAYGVKEGLKAVVPLGGSFIEEDDAAGGEAKLDVASLADVAHESLGFLEFSGVRVGVVGFAQLADEGGYVFRLEEDGIHGDKRNVRGFGVLDEVFPAVEVIVFEGYGGHVLGHEGVHAAKTVAGDEGNHVVFERAEVVEVHWDHFDRCGGGLAAAASSRVPPRDFEAVLLGFSHR